MSKEPSDAAASSPSGQRPVEMRLVVWFDAGTSWRARVSGPGIGEREFASPFELARFVAWPLVLPPPGGGAGLR